MRKTNVYENSTSFVIRMKIALGGVLLVAAFVLRHHWELLIVPILVGFLGCILYRVFTDPVKPT